MKKALVVGINNYPGSPLYGCVNDAIAFASLIENNGDGSPNFAVRQETEIADKSSLMGALSELFSGDGEAAIFYFSGHGLFDAIGGGYIVTPDIQPHVPGISMDEILNLANTSKIRSKVIILDCCHSGAFGSPQMMGGGALIKEGVTILTASRSDQPAIEMGGQGVFTNLLLSALKGGAADLNGYITPGSVYAYIDQALGPWDQRPVFKTNVTYFAPLRRMTPTIAPDILRKIVEYFPTPEEGVMLDPSFEPTEKTFKKENGEIFKNLQKYVGVGLVKPEGEEHMYYAALNSKSCRLTALGLHYWRLVKNRRI